MNEASSYQGHPTPFGGPQSEDPIAEDPGVPVIPAWVREWGFLVLVPAAVMALLGIDHLGQVHGTASGSVLLVTGVCVTAALWWLDYDRRQRVAQALADQALYGHLKMSAIDLMSGRDFEMFLVDLLPHLGYRHVERVGHVKGKQQVDIIATAPDGAPVAIECKRYNSPIEPKIIYELTGGLTAGPWQGRRGILITNALVTKGARDEALERHIEVVDRQRLQEWLAQARNMFEQRSGVPDAEVQPSTSESASPPGPAERCISRIREMRLPAKVAVTVLACAAIELGVIASLPAVAKPAPVARVPLAVPTRVKRSRPGRSARILVANQTGRLDAHRATPRSARTTSHAGVDVSGVRCTE